jgi:beta-glucosidase-like glycosyl hydrolase
MYSDYAYYTSNIPDTVAAALHNRSNFYNIHVQAALDNKTIVEVDVDQALIRTFSVLIRLGYLYPPEDQIYRNLSRVNINTPEAQQLVLRTAQESIVLLKNVDKSLPLNLDQWASKTIALIGPSVNATELMQSNSYHH